jgi:hypothetical protein
MSDLKWMILGCREVENLAMVVIRSSRFTASADYKVTDE